MKHIIDFFGLPRMSPEVMNKLISYAHKVFFSMCGFGTFLCNQ